ALRVYLCTADVSRQDRPASASQGRRTRRKVKIFALAFLPEVTPLSSPPLRLVFRPTLTPYSASLRAGKAERRSDGLETPAGVYEGDRRSRTAGAQRVPGGGASYPASPDRGPCAVDGWRMHAPGRGRPEAEQAGSQGSGQIVTPDTILG